MAPTFREDFDGTALDLGLWKVTQPAGSAMTGVVANQVLTINTGTGVNDSYTLTSLPFFQIPARIKFTVALSQRIANQTFTLQIRNGSGDTVAAWVLDGTVNTSAKVRSTRKTVAAIADAAVTTTASTAQLDYEIDCRVESVDFYTRTADSSSVAVVAATRTRTIPRGNEPYYIEIIAANGAIAPASATSLVVESIFFQDNSAAQQVEVTAGRGVSASARTVPVNMPSGVVMQAGNSRVGFIGAAGQWYDDSTTVLAAAATFTGASRDLAAVATATSFNSSSTFAEEFRLSAESDQAFTLALEVSRDSTTWRRVKAVASAAVTGGGQYAEIVHRPSWRYARVVVVNGATLMGRLTAGSLAVAL